jgi:methionine sulfoxide reductase heme-binding subunit
MTGPRITAAWIALVAGLTGAIFATPDAGEMEFRTTLRVTALTSAIPFLLAFTARALQRLAPSPLSRWSLTNRRYLGLAMAGSHLIHLIAIIGLVETAVNAEPISPLTKAFGGSGFVFLGLMAATSNDIAVQLLGKAWRGLHLMGVWVLWLDFTFTYGGTALATPLHAVMTAIFLGAASLRGAAAWRRRAA